MKDTARFTTVLFLICLSAAVLLSAVHAITEPKIEKARQEQEEAAIKEVAPGARQIEKTEKGDSVYYRAFDNENKLTAYIFICEAKGYSSVIRAVVSVDPAGKIMAVKILEQNETPGIGSQITQDSFLSKLKGKDKTDKFDTISGATISSSALIQAIKSELQKVLP